MATIVVSTNSVLSDLTYVTGDTILVSDGVTLTVNQSFGTKKPTQITSTGTGKIKIENTSTTSAILLDLTYGSGTPRLVAEQNSTLEIKGNWIEVATGTNTDSQLLFTSNNVAGINIDYPTKVQVETGNGTGIFEDWRVLPEDVSGGHVNRFGFNKANTTVGTVAVSSGGTVTGTGTSFSTNMVGLPFRCPSHTEDYVITAVSNTTTMTVQRYDATTYNGGTISAGTSYVIKDSCLVNREEVGNLELGNVLFFNPLTTQVTCGNGTNGNMIPSGAKVRIPNIHITATQFSTTTTTAITSTSNQSITLTNATGLPTTNSSYTSTQSSAGSLLFVNGTTIERIHYTTRSGNVISATNMNRGVFGTTAQSSFPIGTTVYFIPSPITGQVSGATDCDTSGTVDIDTCSFGIFFYPTFSNFFSLKIKNIGGFSRLNVSSSIGTYEVDGISVISEAFTLPGTVPAVFFASSLLGVGTIKNVNISFTQAGFVSNAATSYGLQGQNIINIAEVNNVSSFFYKRNAGTAGISLRGVYLLSFPPTSTIRNLKVVGCSAMFAVSNDYYAKDIYFSDTTFAKTIPVTGLYPFYLATATRASIEGFGLLNGGKATRNYLIGIENTCIDCVIHNKGYPSIDGNSQCHALCNDSGQGTVFSYFDITNPRVQNIGFSAGNQTGGIGGLKRKIRVPSISSEGSATGVFYKSREMLDVVTGPYRYWSSSVTTAVCPNFVDVQPIVVLQNTESDSAGSIFVGAFSAESQYDLYEITSGTPYIDNIGRFYLKTIGDQFVIKSIYPLRSITSFDTVTGYYINFKINTVSTQLSGVTVEFRMSNWGETNNGSWTTFTSMSDLETARQALIGYNSNVGLDLQVRYTATDSTTKYVLNTRFPANLDNTYSPPVYVSKYTFTGTSIGSTAAFYNTTSTPTLITSVLSTTINQTFELDYDFDNSNIPYIAKLRKPGYSFLSFSGTYNATPQTLPVFQTQVLDTSSNPLYMSGQTGATINHSTQTITVTSNISAQQLWSICQDNLSSLSNLLYDDFFVTSNGSSFSCTYDLVINNCVLSGTSTILMPTKNVSFVGTGSTTNFITDSTGTKVNINLTNIVPNSRIQIYNVTDATEIYNAVVTGTSLTLPQTWTSNKTLRVRATYCVGTIAYDPYENTGLFTSSGMSMNLTQVLDEIYNNLVIDGSSVTECSADYPNIFINVTDPDGVTTVQRIYAWFHSIEHTEDGIRFFFGGLDAEDDANFKIDVSKMDLKIFNTSISPVMLIGARLYRSDNSTVIATSSNSVQLDPAKAYIALGSTGATAQQVWEYGTRTITQTIPTAAQNASAVRTELATELGRIDVAVSTRNSIAPDNASVTAIKTKTDNLPADTEQELLDIKTNTNLIPATV